MIGRAVSLMAGGLMAVTLTGCMASTQQEVQMGQQYSAQINQQLPIVRDAEVVRYINALGNSIAKHVDDRHLTWQFQVVNSREVNAFAVPGGFIYVNRGLIERSQNMSQLAGVLGHEIAHVTQRHSMKQMRDAERANAGMSLACVLTNVCQSQVVSTAVNVAGGAVFAGFSRSDESEADRVGIQHVVSAGIDPRGVPQMFRILLDERRSSPGSVNQFFATHPLEEDRIASTTAQIQQIPAQRRQGLRTDDQAFQSFKRRLMALPAAPATSSR